MKNERWKQSKTMGEVKKGWRYRIFQKLWCKEWNSLFVKITIIGNVLLKRTVYKMSFVNSRKCRDSELAPELSMKDFDMIQEDFFFFFMFWRVDFTRVRKKLLNIEEINSLPLSSNTVHLLILKVLFLRKVRCK